MINDDVPTVVRTDIRPQDSDKFCIPMLRQGCPQNPRASRVDVNFASDERPATAREHSTSERRRRRR
ncbi:hypothetical protein P8C59_008971 [Phyllachora maydis]|uniref:Uncharacterized protein n=1 Tax=Phyllachora maydis TaxID=1825666 RepID=A0AAD9MHN9_9PEZI|nr:hypothetical protein P8C59_008971 [Phyllachora maydis]